MADQSGPTGINPTLTTLPISIGGARLPVLGPAGHEGDLIHYAPVAGPQGSVTPAGVPTIAGVDARFAAVPDAPARVTGGFGSRGEALEYANSLHAHNAALKDAKAYAQTAKYLHDLHHEAAQEVEAGDFLSAFGGVRADAADFEDQVSALLAKHPNAGGHPAVQDALSVKSTARQNNFHIAQQNKQEADQEEKVIQAAGAAGFLHPGDLTQPGEVHPELGRPTINKDGSLNRKNLLLLTAIRQAAQKTERGETAAQAADRSDLALHEKQLTALDEAGQKDTPAYAQSKAVRDELYNRITTRDYARLVKTTGPTGPAVVTRPSSAAAFLIRKRTP